MNLHLYKFDALEKEVERLPPLHRIAFAASICERLLPNYNAFSRMENWGDPSILRNALDEVWQILQGEPVNVGKIRQLIEDCTSYDIIPDFDDFGSTYYDAEALEAVIAIKNTLKTCIDPTPQNGIKVASSVTDTIDAFVLHRDESFSASWLEKPLKEQQEAVANHPLAIREMEKQSEDLQRLKQAETLDRDFIEWLRTSFDNDGRSVIDVS